MRSFLNALKAYGECGGQLGPALSRVKELERRDKEQRETRLKTLVRLDQIAVTATERIEPPRWSKYTSSTNCRGIAQTNYFEGYVGETNPRLKVHIVVDENGKLQYVRDIDGTELFVRSRGDTVPPGWK